MSIALDIVRTYRTPREVMARRIGHDVREDRALAVLMGACVLIFIAQWPRLAREAHLDDTIGFDARLAGALFAWLFLAPLLFYVLSLLVQGAFRLIGRHVNGYSVRMAVFWGLLAAAPMFLLTGLTAGFVGPGPALNIVGALAFAALVVFWVSGLSLVATARPETGH
ncbi:MAG: YIP1 family protein [Silicimonas sp.]|nr:YIP1 family protein [Silicimonas sp.]NNF90789.1 YIP1 family protein [Boseongicola sp.]RZW12399.1 MAG: YIP1 family protein [Paracoccaceae bacterium]MBT8424479.1 YIP1 family protein [Silicimonas sp.]NND17186.1 YIP1 family protein [Silicimonas sp.]